MGQYESTVSCTLASVAADEFSRAISTSKLHSAPNPKGWPWAADGERPSLLTASPALLNRPTRWWRDSDFLGRPVGGERHSFLSVERLFPGNRCGAERMPCYGLSVRLSADRPSDTGQRRRRLFTVSHKTLYDFMSGAATVLSEPEALTAWLSEQ